MGNSAAGKYPFLIHLNGARPPYRRRPRRGTLISGEIKLAGVDQRPASRVAFAGERGDLGRIELG